MYLLIVSLLLLFRIGMFVYFVVTEGQYLAPDSVEYINLAMNLLEHQAFSSSLHPPFEPNFFRTLGYPLFLAFLKYLSIGSPYWVVFWQELLYGFSIWIFYHFSQPLFGKKIARAGLLFLLIEPGGFAYPKLFLSETLFLPFVITGLLLVGYYLKKRALRYLALSGFILGLGVIVRPALLYFPIVICFTLVVFDFRSKKQWLHSGLFLLIVVLMVGPWIARNHYYSDNIFISGQQSNVLANYHVPIVWESTRGISFRKGQKIIVKIVNAELKLQESQRGRPLSTIEVYLVQQKVAFKELGKYPAEYAKQWIFGVLKTMMGVNITQVYHTLKINLNRVHYFSIQELDFLNKVWSFLKEQDKVIIFMALLRGMITIFALLGALAIVNGKDCFLWLMMLTNFYFIFIPGPIGSPRFRFSIEGFWFIQAYFGFVWLTSRYNAVRVLRE